MRFSELDEKMRVYETARDYCVLPGMHIVARIDGRNFTKLTKEVHKFEAPFDIKFTDYMIETAKHLMKCGFRIIYGYTQSDEISLLFHPEENTFGRKVRKINSILAGEASAKFTSLLGDIGCFDCRVSELPNIEVVIDYFRWRQADAHRNSLNAHCYWALRRKGFSAIDATNYLSNKTVSDKNEFLSNEGINYNDLPLWQRRGVGLYWKDFVIKGYNPIEKKKVEATRRDIKVDFNLPLGDEYSFLISAIIDGQKYA
ncbi:tRNA(His) guanylyltransferase Thg1 family protein [Acetivibrio straminisolvens]|jgi:tRNA(His) 5'-end guanylyltransferase|uniref:tRNA(His) guanylyltransferase Thg1 family protein n=2 Tax=Acetivibrio straminisolvens TaxID=253314 RepID=UPI002240D724|nr:tRNA(His) guanylyltransferase Thg1 family protein [Acetivibrio straminisolvens]